MGLCMNKELKVYYFTKCRNFGDVLNEYIPEKLFGYKIVKKDVNECDYAFIGSILSPFISTKENKNKIQTPLKIWGSGLIHSINTRKKFIRPIEVHALRGKLTQKTLELMNIKKYDVPLGDPGLLCSRVFDNLDMSKEYEYGIIPHYVDKNNENLNKLQLENSILLDINEEPCVFLSKMVKCKKILSSAMHGLIAADSYGIPNVRMILGDDIVGGDFKYNDYYSAFGIESHEKLDLRNIQSPITNVDINYTISQKDVQLIQDELIRSFPHD